MFCYFSVFLKFNILFILFYFMGKSDDVHCQHCWSRIYNCVETEFVGFMNMLVPVKRDLKCVFINDRV